MDRATAPTWNWGCDVSAGGDERLDEFIRRYAPPAGLGFATIVLWSIASATSSPPVGWLGVACAVAAIVMIRRGFTLMPRRGAASEFGGELKLAKGIAIACPRCGAGGLADPNAIDVTCSACGAVAGHRRCPRCRTALMMPPWVLASVGMAWRCTACGRDSRMKQWNRVRMFHCGTPSAVNRSLYGDHAAQALSNPHRRFIDGVIVAATGVSGLTSGYGALAFDHDYVAVLLGDTSNIRRLNYSDVTAIQIGGRGDVITRTTSGTTWSGGGFGVKGMVEGIAISKALTALSTRTTVRHNVETFVHVVWQSGSVTLLNTHLLPTHWAALLSTVLQRIEGEQQAVRTTRLPNPPPAEEKACPFCAETIKAAAKKCRYCGSELE